MNTEYEYIQTKEIAKQVRKELREAFPSIKFSVTSKFDSISVRYINGVSVKEVETIINKYNGHSDWDSNYCDYQKNNPVEFQGKTVKTYLTYTHVNRDFTEDYLKEVAVYVKQNYAECESDDVIVKVYSSGNAAFDGADWDNLKIYREVAYECSSLEPVALQQQRKREQEKAEYEAWLKEQESLKTAAFLDENIVDIASQKLEEELIDSFQLTPRITKLDIPFFVEGKFAKLNKQSSIEDYKDECDRASYIKQCKITEILEFMPEDYDAFSEMLLNNFEWLKGKGGEDCDYDFGRKIESWDDWDKLTLLEKDIWRKHAYNLCLLVIAPDREPFLVDPQGHNYARYVAFVVTQDLIFDLVSKPKTSNIVKFPIRETIAHSPIEIITTPYPLEPISLSFLKLQYDVISEPAICEPIQLSLWGDHELNELLEARRNRFEEKRERKTEAYQRLQQKHSQLSNSSYQEAKRIGDMIPFGQPILIGHHSERRHRRDAARIDNNMRKSIEHQNIAEYYAEKLAALESNDAISSDDPDAISKLETRLQELEAFQELMRSANKIIRKKTLTDAQKVEQMHSLGIPEKAGYKLLEPDFCNRIGFADYRLQNNNANIRRIKERISELKQSLIEAVKQGNTEQQYPEFRLTVVYNREINRLQLVFDDKPPVEVRSLLKTHGFRWSRNEGAWQRYLNSSSEFAKDLVIKALQNS